MEEAYFKLTRALLLHNAKWIHLVNFSNYLQSTELLIPFNIFILVCRTPFQTARLLPFCPRSSRIDAPLESDESFVSFLSKLFSSLRTSDNKSLKNLKLSIF